MPGVLGFADELINCGEDVEQVFKFLLGRVLVAQDMDARLRQHAEAVSVCAWLHCEGML